MEAHDSRIWPGVAGGAVDAERLAGFGNDRLQRLLNVNLLGQRSRYVQQSSQAIQPTLHLPVRNGRGTGRFLRGHEQSLLIEINDFPLQHHLTTL